MIFLQLSFGNRPIHREPPHGTYAEGECYINKCLTEIRNLKFVPSKKSNLTPDESAALINLQKRDDIVIKPADKGGAVVVWDGKLYIEEAYKELDNPKNYQKLNKKTTTTKQTLSLDQRQISKNVRELISTDALPMTARLLIKHHPKLPTFYLLPKIHKFNNPGRPIVSA